jgi:hypothetical protein
MNAHSVSEFDSRDCTPTEEDYDRFRGLSFLHNRAPLFGEKPEQPLLVAAAQPPAQPVVPQFPPATTTAKANNIAQPYLLTPPVVVRHPQARSVTIMELLQMEVSGKVRLGDIDMEVRVHPSGPLIYNVCFEGKRFYITRFEICTKDNPSTKRLKADCVPAYLKLHKDLRKRFIDVVAQKANLFQANPGYLEALSAGEYVIIKGQHGTMFFVVTGQKREKYLQYLTAVGGGLRIAPESSVKIRRIPNGPPTGTSDDDKLLTFLQKVYTRTT